MSASQLHQENSQETDRQRENKEVIGTSKKIRKWRK